MLNAETKRHIDAARDVLVGVAPNPMTQVDQITYALIYKFMDDMDQSAIKLGGEPSFFVGDLEAYAYSKLMDSRLGNQERMNLYAEALTKFAEAKQLPELFRTIFRAAFLPYRSPETLGLFLKEINFFDYSHPEELGNAYEYLLSIMSAQGDAGQFRTPRHIIDFMVDVLDPSKSDHVLDPACGTGGFLVSTYNHILEKHDGKDDPTGQEKPLTPDERRKLMENFEGYDIDPSMVRIAQVNMYLHLFKNPRIYQYDSLTSDERWNDKFDVILANPPFMSPKGGIKPHSKFGVQSNRSEVLFVDYIASHLKPKGRAAIVVPEGVIFQTGKAFTEIRKNLVQNGLYAVVSLPSGVFNPYSAVKTSILLLNSDISKTRDEVLFVKVTNDGFDLGATKRPIEKNDLPEALSILKAWGEGRPTESSLANIVSREAIAEFGYVLSSDRYLDPEDYSGRDWRFLALEQFVKYEQPTQYIVQSEEYDDSYATPVLTAGKTFILGHTAETEGIYQGPFPVIIFDDFTTATKYVDFPFKVKSSAMKLLHVNPDLALPEFVFHMMQGIEFPYSEHKRYWISEFSKFKVPLPPLEVQKEFVEQLRTYRAVIDGAKQVVTNWKPTLFPDEKWEKMTLADVADWSSGGTPKAGHQDYYGGDIPWAVIGDLTEDLVTVTEKKITQLGLSESSAKVVPEETVLLAMYGASIGRTGIAGIPLATNQAIACARCKPDVIEPWFLLYFLQSQKQQFIAAGAGGAQPNISQTIVKNWPIRVPSIDVQKNILKNLQKERTQILALLELQQTYEERIRRAIYELWHAGDTDK